MKKGRPKKEIVKSATILIRIEDGLKQEFKNICSKSDVSIAQKIREFIKMEIKK